jgi:DNA-binding response OmpR family regulator
MEWAYLLLQGRAQPGRRGFMQGSLTGRSILIVEDEPLIVMDITQAFEGSGAELTTTNTLRHALLLVEHDGLSAAILDHALGDGNSSVLYARLRERGIPFIIYSGYEKVEGACHGAPYISKPAPHQTLRTAVEDLIRDHPQKSN